MATPLLPTAVEAVCEPCPLPSRGERNSNSPRLSASTVLRNDSAKCRAVISLSLHRASEPHSSPRSHSPRKTVPSALSMTTWSPSRNGSATSSCLSLGRPRRSVSYSLPSGSGSPAKDGFSGHTPESRMPTTTPRPASSVPPSSDHTPWSPVSPRNSGVCTVSSWRTSSGRTARTPGCPASFTAWAAVIRAAKPLNATW